MIQPAVSRHTEFTASSEIRLPQMLSFRIALRADDEAGAGRAIRRVVNPAEAGGAKRQPVLARGSDAVEAVVAVIFREIIGGEARVHLDDRVLVDVLIRQREID